MYCANIASAGWTFAEGVFFAWIDNFVANESYFYVTYLEMHFYIFFSIVKEHSTQWPGDGHSWLRKLSAIPQPHK
jgi:hypothetical protein